MSYYRPQTKLREDNVFTPVCHSVQGGGSLSRGGLCPEGGGVLCPEGCMSGGSLSKGDLSWGVSVQGGSLPRGVCVRATHPVL